jgi:tetratricopeptide (TPR) repeat protein
MLRIFLSSTFRDLKDERRVLLDELASALDDVSMENFIPDGRDPHQACIEELRKSDIAIFLISPYYGTYMDRCSIADCKADCPMKNGSDKISYTHCEYKICLADGKPHLTYLMDKDWDLIRELKGKDAIDWEKIREKYDSKDFSSEKIKHYFKVANSAQQFKDEVEKELRIPIADVKGITSDLAESIVKWYQNRKIDLKDFSGRRDKLKELTDKMDECVEVHGVGGIGKTCFIHVALLIQKLKGRKIITIGSRQSYASGSGYKHFKEKCSNEFHEIIGSELTLEDIARALGIHESVFNKDVSEKIKIISENIKNNNICLLLDDFHLSSKEARALPKGIPGGVILASKKKIGCARGEIYLMGIEEDDRYRFIDLAADRFSQELDERARDSIFQIAEGHPVSTEILVRNFDKINFEELKSFKETLKDSDPDHVEELMKRAVKEILRESAYSLLKKLAHLNTEVETDIDRKIVEKIQGKGSDSLFNELLDTGMLGKKMSGKTAYSFSYRHIQDAIREERREDRMWSINYYSSKIREYDKNYLDQMELLYHQSLSNPKEKHVEFFISLCGRICPGQVGFIRLIDIGELLAPRFIKNKMISAPLQGSIANLYSNLSDFKKAEEYFMNAFQLYGELAKRNPYAFNPDLAITLNNLGTLYGKMRYFEKAEEYFKKALGLNEELAKRNSDAFNSDLAGVLNNLGNLYGNQSDFEKADEHYKKALRIYEELAKRNPDAFNSKLAATLNNLASLYYDQSDFGKAEEHYGRALKLREELAKRNPDAFNSDLATTLNNLGSLYSYLREFEKAEEYFKKALGLNEELAKRNSDAFNSDLAMTLNNLGNLYSDLRDFKKAEEHYGRALKLREELAKRNPDAFNSHLATTLNNLGNLYSDLRDFKKAEEHYGRALKLREELAKRNPDAFNSHLATTLNNLGNLYSDLRDFEKAEEHYKRALKLREELAKRNPEAFNSDFAEALNDRGNLHRDINQPEMATQFYKEALSIAHDLDKKNHKAFGYLLIRIKGDMARLYIESGREAEGIDCLNNCLEKKDLLPDLGARSFVALGEAQEKLHNSIDATECYLSAASTYFILFRKGVRCFDDISENLRNAERIGSEETSGDIEMILYAMQCLDGKAIKVPNSHVSERGILLRSALDGKKIEFRPEHNSIIDEMILILSRDLYEKSSKSHD